MTFSSPDVGPAPASSPAGLMTNLQLVAALTLSMTGTGRRISGKLFATNFTAQERLMALSRAERQALIQTHARDLAVADLPVTLLLEISGAVVRFSLIVPTVPKPCDL